MISHSGRETEISVLVGLGNPGREYEATRHNVGFMVIDRMSADVGVMLQERKFRAIWGSGEIEGRKVLLIKPTTYMNRSGQAVAEILKYFGKQADEMIVVHDDLDLPLGRVKVTRGGGAGGHRGVASIIQHVGHQNFPRLKLGIGRPLHGESVEAYVLEPPYKDHRMEFEEMVVRGVETTRYVLSAGMTDAMNRYN